MSVSPDNPLIVQSDRTLFAEVASPHYPEVRDQLCRFAELVKSPEHVHTYRLTDLSLWNAAASGMTYEEIRRVLAEYSRYPVPSHVLCDIEQVVARYGRAQLLPTSDPLILRLEVHAEDADLMERLTHDARLLPMLRERIGPGAFHISANNRGVLKQLLIKRGYPVVDLVGYATGDPCPVRLRAPSTRGGTPFALRAYQREAAERFYQGGSARGGSGVIVLPCGSGKTIVGLAAMASLNAHTLIITTSVAAVHQWMREVLEKTEVAPELVGEYTGQEKTIRPITVTTYHMLVYSREGHETFEHLGVFNAANWGLVIYDEAHLVPAPVFRMTAEIQARRRLGLTATLVREDGQEDDVFSLIGPKRYEVPWKELESQGWIAEARCHEVRIPLGPAHRLSYAMAEPREKFRLASENPLKLTALQALLRRHALEPTLIIGQYLDQLTAIATSLRLPLITGATPHAKREALYAQFLNGQLPVLVLSKVGNFSIDLPDARVLIQVSGMFGSRQEEAQRLGRILRPKSGASIACFYTLVTAETTEQEFAHHRKLFLAEQGYRYQMEAYTLEELSSHPEERHRDAGLERSLATRSA